MPRHECASISGTSVVTMRLSSQAWKPQIQAGSAGWKFSNNGAAPFNDTLSTTGLVEGAPDQPLSDLLSDHGEGSTYDGSVEGLFPETSTGRTTMGQDLDLAPGEGSAAVSSKEAAVDLPATYSPLTLAPQTVEDLPSLEDFFKGPATAPPLSPTDCWALLPSVPLLRPGVQFRDCLPMDNNDMQSEPLNYGLELFVKQEEQLVPNTQPQFPNAVRVANSVMMETILTAMVKKEEQTVPGSRNDLNCPSIFTHGSGIIPTPGLLSCTDDSVVLPDGFTLVPTLHSRLVFRALPTPNRKPLSRKFVRHIDQSQGYNFSAPNLTVEPLTVPQPLPANVFYGHPQGAVPEIMAAPAAISSPIAGMTPSSSAQDLSFADMVPNELPAAKGGDREGAAAAAGAANAANDSPKDGNASHPGIEDGDATDTLRSFRNRKRKQQQQPAVTNGTGATASRMSHSSLCQSDDESNQEDDADNDKVNAEEITFEELSNLFIYKQDAAAKKLGIGSTTLKKVCRKFGLDRWPSRHLKSLINLRGTLTTESEIINKFPAEEVSRALIEIEESLRGRDVSKFLKDFRQKVFKSTHTLKIKNIGVKRKK